MDFHFQIINIPIISLEVCQQQIKKYDFCVQSNELFVLFLLQTKALDILEIPGFHRHIPSDLNNFSLEAKEDFFKFSNQLFKETDSGFYADWQVFTDGMYWSMGIEVNPNNEGDSPIVDFRQTAYEEDEYEDW